jgi:hypothetical protein
VTDQVWEEQYRIYRVRQRRNNLRVAECQVETQGGRDCLRLFPESAPIITPEWWGGAQLNVNGLRIPQSVADRMRRAIAVAGDAVG